ncbi:MAG: ribonuclease [Gallionella sp.]
MPIFSALNRMGKALDIYRAVPAIFLALVVLSACGAQATQQSGLPVIAVAELPVEARDTLRIIKAGGPFPYDRDGVLFKNYEKELPKHPKGYYREYTVKTPGLSHRGARRIVCGPLPECYYTADHYKSFKRIQEQP